MYQGAMRAAATALPTHRLLASVTNLSPAAAVDALRYGPGFVLYPSLLSPSALHRLRDVTYQLAANANANDERADATDATDDTSFATDTGHSNIYAVDETMEGEEVGAGRDGQRLWNLIAQDPHYHPLAAHPTITAIGDGLLGSDHCLGSFAANVLRPGDRGQQPHLDYPYWE